MNDTEKQIQNLLIAVVKMEEVQENTNGNVDKIVLHLDKLLPVHAEIVTIKKALYGFIAVCILFCAWVTLEIHRIDITQKTYMAVQTEKEEQLKKKIESLNSELREKMNGNKNQITYLKGAKLDKPRNR